MNKVVVLLYIAAVATANVLAATYGPTISVFNAFFLIGLVLVLRDKLHVAWAGSPIKMFALICAGGVASALVAPASARIALASCVAFILSESMDYITFSRLKGSLLSRSNRSNLAGAAVDSMIFPLLAFGAIMPWIVVGQFVAKVAGGAAFSWLTFRKRVVVAVAALAIFSSPALASDWIADIGVGGVSVSDGYFAPVVEVFVATPPAQGFRLYGIVSSDLTSGSGEIDTAILAVTRGWFVNGKVFSVNAGATGFRFENFSEAHPFVGATASFPLWKPARFVLTGSVGDGGNATLVAKVAVPIL